MNQNERKNSEGYTDLTAYEALKRVEDEECRLRLLKKTLDDICMLSGFRLKGAVVVVGARDGYSHRL